MNNTIGDYSDRGHSKKENLFMEVTMIVVFVAIIIFDAVVLLGI
jgi:hypothetical protein